MHEDRPSLAELQREESVEIDYDLDEPMTPEQEEMAPTDWALVESDLGHEARLAVTLRSGLWMRVA